MNIDFFFCHRRVKDKKEKENPPKKKGKNMGVMMARAEDRGQVLI